MKLVKVLRARVFVTALLVLTPTVASSIPAAGATQMVAFQCRTGGIAGSFEGTLTFEVDVKAPPSVAPGQDAIIEATVGPRTLPNVGGRLKQIKDITLKAAFPTSSTYVSASLSGGYSVGEVTLREDNEALVIAATGPVLSGATFQLPTLSITVRANDSGTIQSTLGGTSLADPGLTFTAVAQLGVDVDVPVSCYPNPNSVLTSITITPSPVATEQ